MLRTSQHERLMAGAADLATGQTVFAAGFVTAIGKVLEDQQSGRAPII